MSNNYKAYDTVKAKGAQAALSGKTIADCPYTIMDNPQSLFWRKKWLEGFNAVESSDPSRDSCPYHHAERAEDQQSPL